MLKGIEVLGSSTYVCTKGSRDEYVACPYRKKAGTGIHVRCAVRAAGQWSVSLPSRCDQDTIKIRSRYHQYSINIPSRYHQDIKIRSRCHQDIPSRYHQDTCHGRGCIYCTLCEDLYTSSPYHVFFLL